MEKVTINGKEMNLAMNMAVAIEYERQTGKNAFDLEEFSMEKIEPILRIGHAMAKVGNPDIAPFDKFMEEMTDAVESSNFITTTVQVVMDYFGLKQGDVPEQPESKEQKGKQPKNAKQPATTTK